MKCIGVADKVIEHGAPALVRKDLKLDPESLLNTVQEFYNNTVLGAVPISGNGKKKSMETAETAKTEAMENIPPMAKRIKEKKYSRSMDRCSQIKRVTSETQIEISLVLDGTGQGDIQTPIPFMDHMLAQLSRHGYFDLTVKAKGDTHIDFHHTVEDLGIALGQAFEKALGDKKGIRRFAQSSVPLNEALVNCVVDLSRSYFRVQYRPAQGETGRV